MGDKWKVKTEALFCRHSLIFTLLGCSQTMLKCKNWDVLSSISNTISQSANHVAAVQYKKSCRYRASANISIKHQNGEKIDLRSLWLVVGWALSKSKWTKLSYQATFRLRDSLTCTSWKRKAQVFGYHILTYVCVITNTQAHTHTIIFSHTLPYIHTYFQTSLPYYNTLPHTPSYSLAHNIKPLTCTVKPLSHTVILSQSLCEGNFGCVWETLGLFEQD